MTSQRLGRSKAKIQSQQIAAKQRKERQLPAAQPFVMSQGEAVRSWHSEDRTSAGGRTETEADVGLRASSEVSLWNLPLVPAIFRLKLTKKNTTKNPKIKGSGKGRPGAITLSQPQRKGRNGRVFQPPPPGNYNIKVLLVRGHTAEGLWGWEGGEGLLGGRRGLCHSRAGSQKKEGGDGGRRGDSIQWTL